MTPYWQGHKRKRPVLRKETWGTFRYTVEEAKRRGDFANRLRRMGELYRAAGASPFGPDYAWATGQQIRDRLWVLMRAAGLRPIAGPERPHPW